MINTSRPFIAYVTATVQYDGRAYSELELGNYIVISKQDKSVQIHTSTKITPINYQKAGSKITIDNDTILVVNKRESIKIKINNLLSITYLDDWSDTKLKLFKTEKELVDKIVEKWDDYVGIKVDTIIKEYKTQLGPIDIAGESDNELVLIEVKRNSISCNNIYQLKKYIDTTEDKRPIKPFIAGPSIKQNAMEVCQKNSISYIEVRF